MRGQKMGNWWHYHKWTVLLAAALLIVAGVLFAGWFDQTQPDLRVGYVAAQALDQDAADRLQAVLESLCGDSNGDGQTLVWLEQYVVSFRGNAQDANAQMAGMARLSADLRTPDGPAIFLLDDPEGLQQSIGALEYLDGAQPPGQPPYDAQNWRRMVWDVQDCPPLAGIAELQGLYIARRAESISPAPEAAAALWRTLMDYAP